jgi:hypothetical protein
MCLLQGFYAHFVTGKVGTYALAPTGPAQSFETRKQAATFARDFAPAEAAKPGTMYWLHRLLENERLETHDDFLSLVASSRRLVDSPTGALYQGLVHYAFGRFTAAKACFNDAAKVASAETRIFALRNLEAAMFQLDDWSGVLQTSLAKIRIASGLGMDAQLSAELWRLGSMRAANANIRRMKLPQQVSKLALTMAGSFPASSISVIDFPQGRPQDLSLQYGIDELLGEHDS